MSGMYIEVLAATNLPFDGLPYPPEVLPLLDYKPLWKNDLKNDLSLTCEGVQVVEGVGLVASSFQFFTRLGSVFAEEVDDCGSSVLETRGHI